MTLLVLLLSLLSFQPSLALASSPQITDVLVFTNPEDEQRLIVAATLTTLDPATLYQFNFDTNRDGIEDRVVQVTLHGDAQLEASVSVPSIPERTGTTIQAVKADRVNGAVSTHASPIVLSERGKSIRAFVGLRKNPRADGTLQALVLDLPLSAILAEHKSDLDIWVSAYQQESR
ncbi:MAG: hypothetical protein U0517_04050 [Candidatus Andersenbacteria bacterium]